jgi:hypothetical protein
VPEVRGDYIATIFDDGTVSSVWEGSIYEPLAIDGRYAIVRSCYVAPVLDGCGLGRFDVRAGVFSWYTYLPYRGQPNILGIVQQSQ